MASNAIITRMPISATAHSTHQFRTTRTATDTITPSMHMTVHRRPGFPIFANRGRAIAARIPSALTVPSVVNARVWANAPGRKYHPNICANPAANERPSDAMRTRRSTRPRSCSALTARKYTMVNAITVTSDVDSDTLRPKMLLACVAENIVAMSVAARRPGTPLSMGVERIVSLPLTTTPNSHTTRPTDATTTRRSCLLYSKIDDVHGR